MYFILQYIDYHDFKKQPDHPASTIQINKTKADEAKTASVTKGLKNKSRSSASKPSVVSTNDSLNAPSTSSLENKEVLVNPDCYLGSILDYICEVVGLPRHFYFTMCTASSELMTVVDAPLSTPGLEFFIPRETYYIILKEYDPFGNEVFFPLLNKHSEIYSYFSTKLKKDVDERPRKSSNESSSSSKLKIKDVTKVRNRVKSATSQKERKSQTSTTLPPIKQKNSAV